MNKNSVNIDKHCKETLVWIKSVAELTNWPDREDWAFNALKSVLHAIRDRTTIEEACHLSAQLPIVIRGYFFEGYNPSAAKKRRSSKEFLKDIQDKLGTTSAISPEEAFSAVLHVLYDHVSFGEMEEVKKTMPKNIVKLWNAGNMFVEE